MKQTKIMRYLTRNIESIYREIIDRCMSDIDAEVKKFYAQMTNVTEGDKNKSDCTRKRKFFIHNKLYFIIFKILNFA